MNARIVVVLGVLVVGCGTSMSESTQNDEQTGAAATVLVADTNALTDAVCGDCQSCTGQACRDCLDSHAAGTKKAMGTAAAALRGDKALHEIQSHKDLSLPDAEREEFLAAVERGNQCAQKITDRAPWGLGSTDGGATNSPTDAGAAK